MLISQHLFASNNQLEYVRRNIIDMPIYSEASVRNFERDTVDNFVQNIIDILMRDDTLRRSFHLRSRVAFEDRANLEGSTETSLEEAMGQSHVDNPSRPQRQAARNNRPSKEKLHKELIR